VSSRRLLLATRNQEKLAELCRILGSSELSDVQVVGLEDVPPFPEKPETAATFEANALAKAQDAAAATGLATVADDSGLEVDALGSREKKWEEEGNRERYGVEKNGANLGRMKY